MQQAAGRGDIQSLLLPVDTLFSGCERFELSVNQEKCIRNGGVFSTEDPAGRYRAYSRSGEFIALTEIAGGEMHAIKSFFEV